MAGIMIGHADPTELWIGDGARTIGILPHGDRCRTDAIDAVSDDRPCRARDMGDRLQSLQHRNIIRRMHDRAKPMGDKVEVVERRTLAVQLRKETRHACRRA